MKAYSYVRFSNPDQLRGDSQRRQVEAAEQWCKKNDAELVTTYSDLGISAFRGKNAETGALSNFLALVRKGRIPRGSFLVVESLDRVSRNTITKALRLFLDIIDAGIKVVTLTDNRVYDEKQINDGGSADLIISISVMTRANEESRTKGVRISKAWEAKRERIGEKKLTGKCVMWLKLSDDKKRFELLPKRVKIVKRIFDMAVHGHGANSIAKTLNREKVETIGYADAWNISYIKRILENRAAIGEFVPGFKRDGKRILLDAIKDYYPQIVSRETFACVQQLRKARPCFNGRANPFNVFARLAFDRETNTAMRHVNKGRGERYLVPFAAIIGKAKHSSWRYDEFLAMFLTVCERAALTQPPDVDADTGALAIANMELDDVEKQIDRLADFIAKGASAAVESKLRETEQRKAELQTRVRDLENTAVAKPTDLAAVNWKDSKRLRENLRSVVKKIMVDAKRKWFAVEWLDGRPIHIFSANTDMTDEEMHRAESKTWRGTKIPLAELFKLAKRKGYLPAGYEPRNVTGTALIYSSDKNIY